MRVRGREEEGACVHINMHVDVGLSTSLLETYRKIILVAK